MNKHLNVTATFEKEATRDDKGKTEFRFKVGSWCVRDLLKLDKNYVFIWID